MSGLEKSDLKIFLLVEKWQVWNTVETLVETEYGGKHHMLVFFQVAASGKETASGKEPICQCRRCKKHRFDPWVGKIP